MISRCMTLSLSSNGLEFPGSTFQRPIWALLCSVMMRSHHGERPDFYQRAFLSDSSSPSFYFLPLFTFPPEKQSGMGFGASWALPSPKPQLKGFPRSRVLGCPSGWLWCSWFPSSSFWKCWMACVKLINMEFLWRGAWVISIFKTLLFSNNFQRTETVQRIPAYLPRTAQMLTRPHICFILFSLPVNFLICEQLC